MCIFTKNILIGVYNYKNEKPLISQSDMSGSESHDGDFLVRAGYRSSSESGFVCVESQLNTNSIFGSFKSNTIF